MDFWMVMKFRDLERKQISITSMKLLPHMRSRRIRMKFK